MLSIMKLCPALKPEEVLVMRFDLALRLINTANALHEKVAAELESHREASGSVKKLGNGVEVHKINSMDSFKAFIAGQGML